MIIFFRERAKPVSANAADDLLIKPTNNDNATKTTATATKTRQQKTWNNSTQVDSEKPQKRIKVLPTSGIGVGGASVIYGKERRVKSLILRDAVSKLRPNRAYELRKTSQSTVSKQLNGKPGTYKKI